MILLCLWWGLAPLLTQAASPVDAEILDLKTELNGQLANRFVAVLEDPDGRLTLDVLQTPDGEKRFVPIGLGKSNRGVTASAWWLRLDVVNNTNQPVHWLLEATHPHTDFLDGFIFADTRLVKAYILGDMRPFAQRPIPFESFLLPIETPAFGHNRIFLRMAYVDVGLIDQQLRFWSPVAFGNHRDQMGLLQGAYLGGLFFMFLYNLFIFFSTRMAEYFWYVLYIAISFFAGSASIGLGHRYLFYDPAYLSNNFHVIMMSLNLFAVLQFSRVFLKTAKNFPRVDLLLRLILALFITIVLLLLMGNRVLAVEILERLAFSVLLCPFLGIWTWYIGEKQARLYTLAWMIAGVLFTLSMGRWIGLNESSFLTNWAGRIGQWIEAVMFSLALADHINLLRREKEKIQQRQQEFLLQTKVDLERKVWERTRDLEAAKFQADAANAAKGAFLATVSHEIRTPISGILGMTHLALHTVLSELQRDYLNKIQFSTRYLLEIINNILDFSKLEAEKMVVEHIAFSLADVVENLSSLFSAKARSSNLELQIVVAQGIPGRLLGDPLRLKQVLANLMSNAIKFTESGWVRLEINLESQVAEQVTLVFLVKDTGMGMTVAQQESLFQEFSQVDATISRKYGGTGLGLSISQRLVTQMGGKIRVVSTPGGGSVFSFTLVFFLPHAEKSLSSPLFADDSEEEPPPEFQPAHILLVEDNPINQQVSRELLQAVGLTVTLANNGIEAVEAVRREPFDLVLMDVQMPQMDGFQATAMIRADDRLRRLPIIAMTAHVLSGEYEKYQSIGMNGHVSKPVEPVRLYRLLSQWLPSRPRKRSMASPTGGGADAAIPPLPESLPDIDLVQGLGKVRQNHPLFRKLLLEFYQDHGSTILHLGEAIGQGKVDEAMHMAHTIRGVAGNLGALKLAKAAAHLEAGIRSSSSIDKHWQIFQVAFATVMAGLATLANSEINKTRVPSGRETDREALAPLVDKLREALREATPQSMDWLAPMEKVMGDAHMEVLGDLRQKINGFQFDEAMVILADLAEKTGLNRSESIC